MRFHRAFACLVLLVGYSFLAWAQSPDSIPPELTASQLNLPLLTALPPVTQANVALVGNPGTGTYHYWLVANYTFGQSALSHMFKLSNGPTVLTGSNYITITPVYPAGAISVDLLRTTSDAPPSGTGNYAVSTGNTSGAISDTGGALSSYTVNAASPDSNTLCLNNKVTAAGTSHLILGQGTPTNCLFVADLSAIGTSTGTVTQINPSGPITVTPNPITTVGTIGMSLSGVTAGPYTLATITVNSFGLVTGASSNAFPTLYNQTLEDNGTALAQEPKFNLIPGTNMTITCVDNSGATRTDCTFASTGGGGGSVSGSGTGGTLPEWTGTGASTALGNSPIVDGGTTGITITNPATGEFDLTSGVSTGSQLLLGGASASFINAYLGNVPFTVWNGAATISSGCEWSNSVTCTAFDSSGDKSGLVLSATSASGQHSWQLDDNTNNIIQGVPVGGSGSAAGVQLRVGSGFSINAYVNSTAIFGINSSGANLSTGTLTLVPITGTQCLEAVSGVVTGTGAACGSGAGNVTGSGLTSGAAIQGAAGSAIAANAGTYVEGQPVVGNVAANNVQTSTAYVDATPFISGLSAGTDLCAVAQTLTTANPFSTIDLRGFPTKFYCNSPVILVPTTSAGAAATFSGTVLWPNSVVFVNSVTGFQSFPSGTVSHGGGRTAGTTYTAGTGTTFEVCNSTYIVSGDYATYCHSTPYSGSLTADGVNYPAVLALSNYASSQGIKWNTGGTAPGVGFGARVDGFDVGCEMAANVTAFANWEEQEQSALFNFRWHNCTAANDIGLDWGGGWTGGLPANGGGQNSWFYDFQGSTAALAGCTNSPTARGIRISTYNGSNGNPNIGEKGSIVDNCSGGTVPAYNIEYSSGSLAGMKLIGIHMESFGVAGIAEGVSTQGGTAIGETANGLELDTVDCGSPTASGSCILLLNTSGLSGATVTNTLVVNSRAVNSAITNTINDQNHTAITQTSFPYVSTYSTNASGAVIIDTTKTNPSIFLASPTLATTPANVPELFGQTPTGSAAGPVQQYLPGIAGRSVTGTTDTILSTDCNPTRVAYTGSSAVAVTLPTATTLAVPSCTLKLANNTTQTVTITPTTWTISAGSGGTAGATLALLEGQEAVIFVDAKTSNNWAADVVEQALTPGTGITLTRSPSGITVTSTVTSGVTSIFGQTGAITALTVPTGDTLLPTGTGIVGANELENNVTNANGATSNTTITGGANSATTGQLGNLILTGGIQGGTPGGAGSIAGGVEVLGGQNSVSNAASNAGSIEIIAGSSNNSGTNGQQGLIENLEQFPKDSGTATQFDLACLTATGTKTAQNCGVSPTAIAGVIYLQFGTGTPVLTLAVPPSEITINASAAVTVGHTVCAGTTAGEVTDSGGTGACPAGQLLVGSVEAITGSWTLPDGTVLTASSTIPLIQLSALGLQTSATTTPSFPLTVAGTVTSGGMPYFSSTTQESSSGLLASGDFVLGGGAGGAPTATFATVPINKGGTNAITAAAALVNLFPTASEVGDVVYCSAFSSGNCTAWSIFAGNTSGTNCFTENTSGVPAWAVCGTGSGATVALNNLSAVAINAALLPGTTNSIALGSSSEYWSNLFSTAIQCGIAGTTGCVISGAGSTSGTATITWPAVAGTASNSIGFSNNLQIPQGGSYTWSTSASVPSSTGASIGLVGTSTHEIINPSTILLLPQCKVTAAVNMTVSGTPVTFCTLTTLPNSAQTWGWQCSGTYTTTTASDTFSLGYTAAQAPTGVTGNAIIYSNLTGTSTAGSVTSTTSTANQTMLTGASVSSVTNEPFSTSGVIQASATQGTFVLTGTLTGTSPSGSINPGTTCQIY